MLRRYDKKAMQETNRGLWADGIVPERTDQKTNDKKKKRYFN